MNAFLSNLRRSVFRFVSMVTFVTVSAHLAHAQEESSSRFAAAESPGVTATQIGTKLVLEIDDPELKSLRIPRLAASLRSMLWMGDTGTELGVIALKPEQDEWIIEWQSKPANAKSLVLDFDAIPQPLSDVSPVAASGDGSFFLPAFMATTVGEKIRYEPQTFKNTVGYWVGKQDSAIWKFNVEIPGSFNVAILQGCGAGQGGSDAKLTIASSTRDQPLAAIDFKVLETGHFQNFQWRHLGEVEIDVAGELQLRVAPMAIKKNALMDIRAIHLVRLPGKK